MQNKKTAAVKKRTTKKTVANLEIRKSMPATVYMTDILHNDILELGNHHNSLVRSVNQINADYKDFATAYNSHIDDVANAIDKRIETENKIGAIVNTLIDRIEALEKQVNG